MVLEVQQDVAKLKPVLEEINTAITAPGKPTPALLNTMIGARAAVVEARALAAITQAYQISAQNNNVDFWFDSLAGESLVDTI